jgi:hypothetical protein
MDAQHVRKNPSGFLMVPKGKKFGVLNAMLDLQNQSVKIEQGSNLKNNAR